MGSVLKMMKNLSQIQSPEVIEAIDEIVKGINKCETIVFCGAGISYNSGLPVVNQFIPYVLLTLCASHQEIQKIEEELESIENGTKRLNRSIEIISEKMEVSERAIQRIMNALPFEAFIETLRDNSKIDKIFDIYDADKYNPPVEPNTNHIFLAKLVSANKLKTIVTTNFDQLIEKALEMEGKKEGEDFGVLYREGDFEKIDWAQDRVRLIKIHGSVHDKNSMAITLSQVAKKELSQARANIIDQVYSKGKHRNVLILGYSCSDVFDLSPQIEAIKGNQKEVFLVQHSDGQGVEDIRKHEGKNPFKKFINSKRLSLNTNQLIEAFWRSIIDGTYASKKSDTNWKERVDVWHSESLQHRSEAYKYVILGLLFDRIAEWEAVIRFYEYGLKISKGNYFKHGEGICLGNLGNTYKSLGEYRKAIEYYEQTLKILRDIGDKRSEGICLGNLGSAYNSLGEYRKAIEYYEQALEISRDIGDKRSEGICLGNLGSAYDSLGEYRKAIEYSEQALKISRDIGDKRNEGLWLGNLGFTYNNLGEYRKAIEYFEQALKISKDIGDKRNEGSCLGNLGSAYDSLGEYRKAIEYFEQALKISRDIGNKQGEGDWLGNLGIAYNNLGEYRKAIEYFEQALKISKDIGDKQGEGSCLGNLGFTYNNLGEYRKAIEYFEQALEISKDIGDKRSEGICLGNLGGAYNNLGEYRKAIEYFEQTLKISRDIGNKRNEGICLGNLGGAYNNLGEYRKAIEYFEQTLLILRTLLPLNHPHIKTIESNLQRVKLIFYSW
jgi:tetratricopeptide (TPR) repeat protein